MRPRLAPLRPLRVTVVVGESRPPSYTVVAPLLRTRPGAPTYACMAVLDSLPPAGCSGVPVTGIDIRRQPGARSIGRAWQTGPLRLAGRWDGRALQVTAPPTPSHTTPGPEQPLRCRVPSTSFASALANRIVALRADLGVLGTSACGGTAWVV